MKRVAIFGNAGGGKSTLARRLAGITGLPLYVIDKLQFEEGGAAAPIAVYQERHHKLMAEGAWIIDGYGDPETLWERLAAADTLVYVDLPLAAHYWRVTKRFLGGLFADPEGWPKGSPLWRSTLSSYQVIPLCHKHLTPRYRRFVAESAAAKRVAHLRSPRDTAAFLTEVRREFAAPLRAAPHSR
jgi:hypothetical protein